MIDAPIKAMLQYYGGKRSMATKIVDALGFHRSYFEPFCGGISIIFSKPPAAMETLNDMHGDVINLACVIANDAACANLHERLCRTLFVQSIFEEATSVLASNGLPTVDRVLGVEPIHIDRAYWYFIQSWMGRGGVVGCDRDNQFAVRYTPGGGHGGTRFRSAVDSLPAWHLRLRHCTITRQDGIKLIDKLDDVPGVAIYCDPPYEKDSRGSSSRYLFDFNMNDHERMANALDRFINAKVVISYYDFPALKDLYPTRKWTWQRHQVASALANMNEESRQGGEGKAIELLICNNPSGRLRK